MTDETVPDRHPDRRRAASAKSRPRQGRSASSGIIGGILLIVVGIIACCLLLVSE